jgi:HEAT repeat protein
VSPSPDPERAAILDDLANSDEEVRRLAVERLLVLPPADAVPRLIESLGDASWRVRKAAVGRLVCCPELDGAVDALIRALGDGDNPGRRNSAVEALMALGSGVTPQLVTALQSGDADVRKLLIDALAGIADPSSCDAMIGSLGDRDPNVRAAAADALAGVAGEAATPALSAAALCEDEEQLVRFSALRSLVQLEIAIAPGELSGVLSDPVLRSAGLLLLGHCEDAESAEELLLKALSEASQGDREAAMQGLLCWLSRLDGAQLDAMASRVREAARATPNLLAKALERLETADLRLRLIHLQFLGLLAAEESIVPMLESARDEAMCEPVIAMLQSLGDVTETALEAAWGKLDGELRRIGCAALALTAGATGQALLQSSLDDSDGLLRAAAARSLAERGAQVVIPDLVRRLEVAALDDDPDAPEELEVLLDALLALVRRGAEDAAGPVVDLLVARLEAPSEPVRRMAARVLARVARRQDGERMMVLLKDPSASVRRLAVEGLSRLDSETAAESLRLALADESALVRVAAASGLGASQRETALDDLWRLSEDPDLQVRAAALRAIGTRCAGPGSVAAESLATTMDLLAAPLSVERKDGMVAVAAVEALDLIGGVEAAERCVPALASSELEVVRAAIACVGRHGDGGCLSRLIQLVDHSSWAVRGEAVGCLGERRFAKALPAILRRLETEQDAFVRDRILKATQRLED